MYCSASHTSATCVVYCQIHLPETWLLEGYSSAHIVSFDLEGTPYFSPIYFFFIIPYLASASEAQWLLFWSLLLPLRGVSPL